MFQLTRPAHTRARAPGITDTRARPPAGITGIVLFLAVLLFSFFAGRSAVYAADVTVNEITDGGSYFTWTTAAHSSSSGSTDLHFRSIGWDFKVTSGSTTKYAQFYTGAGEGDASDGINSTSFTSGSATYNTITLDKQALEDATGIDIGTGSVTITANAIVQILDGDDVLATYNLRTQLSAANAKLESLNFQGRFVESGSLPDYVGYVNQSVTITYYKVTIKAGTGISSVAINPAIGDKESSTSTVTMWVPKGQSVTVSYSTAAGYSFKSYSYGKTSSYGSTRTTEGLKW